MKGSPKTKLVEEAFQKYRVWKMAIELDADRPEEWTEYCEFIDQIVSELDERLRSVVYERFIKDVLTDIEAYTNLGIGETSYYFLKRRVVDQLSTRIKDAAFELAGLGISEQNEVRAR